MSEEILERAAFAVVLHTANGDTPSEVARACLEAANYPDLFEALETLCTDVENKWGDPHTLRHALAALSKARGEPVPPILTTGRG